MKQYKVIALSVGADSNRIFNAGEIVNEDAWITPGRAEELKEQGFLEDYTPEEGSEEVPPVVPPVTEPVEEEDAPPVIPPVTEPVKETTVVAPKKPTGKK